MYMIIILDTLLNYMLNLIEQILVHIVYKFMVSDYGICCVRISQKFLRYLFLNRNVETSDIYIYLILTHKYLNVFLFLTLWTVMSYFVFCF